MPSFDISQLKKMSAEMGMKTLSSATEEKNKYGDDRFWKPEFDKGGNANAIIRLLPSLNPEDLPWIVKESYFFKGPSGQWYINNSRRMLGEADPMYEYVHKLYTEAGNDEEKKSVLSKYRATKKYVCNAIVIKDPAHPENEGKVVLFEFGKIIYNKIIEKLKPTFEGDEKINVFDWTRGANLRLKIYREGGFPRYDRCEFAEPSALDDATIERVVGKMYNLKEFFEPKYFRSYEDLQKRIREIFMLDTPVASPRTNTVETSRNVSNTNEFGVKREVTKTSEKSEDWSSLDSIADLDFDKMMSEI